MEIKKGISQMAEYPNVEVNYVVPEDGNMYYVLKNGELSNGSIIATLDPKKVIDDGVVCDNIGVFKEDGSVLIDFDKKEIKRVNDDFLLVVNSIPKSELVVNALKNENDEISKTMMKDNSTTIVDKMMIEMGITGEILFSDAYSEANIYKTDMPNNKIGPDCSFIGKNDSNFYFHTNDSTQDTVVINFNGQNFQQVDQGFEMPTASIDEVVEIPVENTIETQVENVVENAVENTEDVVFSTDISSMEDFDSQDLKLDISQNILDGFKPIEETVNATDTMEVSDVSEVESNVVENGIIENDFSIPMPTEEVAVEETEVTDEPTTNDNIVVDTNDEVLDNAIEVVKKMIEETSKLNEKINELEEENNKLNEKISSLEEELSAKTQIIVAQESKKNELNDLLEEANEVLENID